MQADQASSLTWFRRGAVNAMALPVVVLMAAQVGFAALARDAGFTLVETLFLTCGVWALPSQVVFVGLIGSGASMPGVVVAVALSAVRFMPMVMAWVPIVRTPTTPRWLLLFMSWFVAVTAWVFAMAHLPHMERQARLPFFAGFAITLTVANTLIVAIAYSAIDTMPPLLAAALVFLTPIYFMTAMWAAARSRADYLAMASGLVLGPLFAWLAPAADLLLAGIVGGTLAYAVGRRRRRHGA